MLDKNLIKSVNGKSHFNLGEGMEKRAKNSLRLFDENFPLTEDLSEKQKEYLALEKVRYEKFIIDLYNTALLKRSRWMPVVVCGPANYNHKQQERYADNYMEFMASVHGRINSRLETIEKRLKRLTPIDKQVEDIKRTGDCNPISSDDPNALEKLNAKLEHYEKIHKMMVDANAYKRKHKTLIGFTGGLTEENCKRLSEIDGPPFARFQLQNSNQTIKQIKNRIETINNLNSLENKEYSKSWGKVVFNYELKRVQFLFDEKPGEEVRNLLKSRAFRWSPKNNAWQRILSNDAIYITKLILKDDLLKEEKEF